MKERRIPGYMKPTTASMMKQQLPVKREPVEPKKPRRKRWRGNMIQTVLFLPL